MNTKSTVYYSPPQPMIGKRHVFAALLMLSFSCNVISQTCQAAIEATTPTIHFTVHNNGTVTHEKTGLMWQVCSQGQSWNVGSCSGTASTHNWQQALQIPDILNPGGGYAGHTDWRLPNIKELSSLAELKCHSPAINETIFPATGSVGYWSSTPSFAISNFTFFVFFQEGIGSLNLRSNNYSARLVRGGQ